MSGFKQSCSHGSSICSCTDTPKIPLTSIPGCSNDLAAVLALPDQWTPRRCSPILINYLAERKCSHEKAMNKLIKEASTVNKNIDDKVRELSEVLLAHIENNQKDFNCVVEYSRNKIIPLSTEDRNYAHKQITDLYCVRIQDISKYKNEALALERRRAEDLKNIFQCNFQKLIAIGHYSPKELLHDFDQRIFEINQQIISNSRAYTDLEAYLRAQLDEFVMHIRSSINELCLTSIVRTRHQSASSWISLTRGIRRAKRSLSVDSRTDKKLRDPMESRHSVNINLEEFQDCISNLVENYRGVIKGIFSSFTDFLEELHKNVGDNHYLRHKEKVIFNLNEMTDRAIHRISDSSTQLKIKTNQEFIDMTRNDLVNMQKTLFFLGDRLRSTYMILHDASLLLNPHMLRSALAQKLSVTAVEDMQTNFDILELANEIAFNISLEQLRGAPDIEKLQQQYDFIINFLDKINDTYAHQKESETAKFEEFMDIQPLLANALLSEHSCFVENNPKFAYQISESKTSTASYGSLRPLSFSSLRAPLPRAIIQTKLQDVALTNWRNGFLESLENNIRFIPDEMKQLARKWVDEKILMISIRYSVKCMLNSIRPERVQAARDIRLAELRLHETRLSNHLDAVYDLVNTLPIQASEFLALNAPELYPLCKWVEDIQNKINQLLEIDPLDPEVKRLKMTSYTARLIRHQQLFEESLHSAVEQFKKNVEVRIQTVRISNFQFMSKLKLFNEGGRYAAAEVAKTSAALVKASDVLENCSSKIFEALNNRRTHLLTLADQLLVPLRRVLEETVKISGKGQDKKKPPTNKKK